jgi:HipA-like C-terminal domain
VGPARAYEPADRTRRRRERSGRPRPDPIAPAVRVRPRWSPRLPKLPDGYVARGRESASLDELATSAQRVEEGVPLSPALDAALLHGSSIGGARPKALIDDGLRRLIAKFSSTTDTFPVEQGEYVGMELARRARMKVARVELTQALNKSVLLVERFDRLPETDERRSLVSALTMLGLNELAARHASYADLARSRGKLHRSRLESARALLADHLQHPRRQHRRPRPK